MSTEPSPSPVKKPAAHRLFRRRLSRRGAAPRPGHLRAWMYRASEPRAREVPPDGIREAIDQPEALVWLDIQDPGTAEMDLLRREFGFSDLSLADAMKQRLRPKVDEYPGYYFVVLYAPVIARSGKEIETVEVDLFVGSKYVVSLHREGVPTLDEAFRRWEETPAEVHNRSGFLAHAIVDSIIDAYFPVVDEIDDRLDRLELSMFRSQSSANSEELLSLKRSLFALRKAITPLREAFQSFPNPDHSLFALETHPYFQDVYDHILRLLDIIDIQRDMVVGTTDAHLAFVSNQLNETMKTLTVLGICVAVAGAVYGAWGMNVAGVPFARMHIGHTYVGFWMVTGLTFILILIALAWTRRRGLW